jgi:electron transfer flavoprotein alpha subunit
MTSLVIAEHDNASIKTATLNTVTAAKACGGDVHVLVAGEGAAAAAAAAAQIAGVSKVIHADGASLKDGLAENVAAQVLAIAGNYSHILFPRPPRARTWPPRGRQAGRGPDQRHHQGRLRRHLRAPIYAGNAIATVQSADAVKVITVRTTALTQRLPLAARRRWKRRLPWPTAARAPLWAAK